MARLRRHYLFTRRNVARKLEHGISSRPHNIQQTQSRTLSECELLLGEVSRVQRARGNRQASFQSSTKCVIMPSQSITIGHIEKLGGCGHRSRDGESNWLGTVFGGAMRHNGEVSWGFHVDTTVFWEPTDDFWLYRSSQSYKFIITSGRRCALKPADQKMKCP